MQETKPWNIKKLGRNVCNYVDETWTTYREDLVYKGLLEKYRQNSHLKAAILATGDRILVEASPHDRIWGVGLGENDPDIDDERNWKGTNLLGKVLMRVRDTIKTETV